MDPFAPICCCLGADTCVGVSFQRKPGGFCAEFRILTVWKSVELFAIGAYAIFLYLGYELTARVKESNMEERLDAFGSTLRYMLGVAGVLAALLVLGSLLPLSTIWLLAPGRDPALLANQ